MVKSHEEQRFKGIISLRISCAMGSYSCQKLFIERRYLPIKRFRTTMRNKDECVVVEFTKARPLSPPAFVPC